MRTKPLTWNMREALKNIRAKRDPNAPATIHALGQHKLATFRISDMRWHLTRLGAKALRTGRYILHDRGVP